MRPEQKKVTSQREGAAASRGREKKTSLTSVRAAAACTRAKRARENQARALMDAQPSREPARRAREKERKALALSAPE